MTDVAYNSPQYGYGYGTGVPPQPVPPQPMPMPAAESVSSYDVDPSPGHAPPAIVTSGEPAGAANVDRSAEDAAATSRSLPVAPPVSVEPAETADASAPVEAGSDEADDPVPSISSSGRVAVQVVDRLRSTGERGTTTVPTPVIEKIATLAVREVPGVHDFAARETAGGSSWSVAGGGDAGDERTLAIEVDGKAATVTLHLVIEYGFAVHSVTEKVRTKVISALENLFSLDITAVDIVIDDIHLDEAAE